MGFNALKFSGERSGIKHLDQLTVGDNLLPYVSFLRLRKTTKHTLFELR
jgi:hypothetical protein